MKPAINAIVATETMLNLIRRTQTDRFPPLLQHSLAIVSMQE